MAQAFYPLPNYRAGTLMAVVYMNLQLPRCTADVSPHRWWALTPPSHPYLAAVVFFYITQPLRTACKLASGTPCVARTFLSHTHKDVPATDRPTAFQRAKVALKIEE